MEVGCHFTVIKDAAATFDQTGMCVVLEVNGPGYAYALLTTDELLARQSS
jgi:hypothetical protein